MEGVFGANLNNVNEKEDREMLKKKKSAFLLALFPKGLPKTVDEPSEKILEKVRGFTTLAEMNLFEQMLMNTFAIAKQSGRSPTPEEIYRALGISPVNESSKRPSLNTFTPSSPNQPPPGKMRPLGDSISP